MFHRRSFPFTLLLLTTTLISKATSFTPSNPTFLHALTQLCAGASRTTQDILSLESIRSSLIRQEETIIFALIERAQFLTNDVVYRAESGLLTERTAELPQGAVYRGAEEKGRKLSFMEYMLMGTEILHSSVRRYTSPEEHAFFPDYIPDPIDELAKLQYPDNLLSEENGAASCCINDALLKRYVDEVIPAVCESGDDEQHGSSVLADVNVLQALSKRIHYGKFVAESKYRSDPEGYQKLVDNNDVDGVMKLLTNAAVEKKVLKRAKMKCATYGREPLVDALAEREGEDDELTAIVAAAAAAAAVAAVETMNIAEKSNDLKLQPAVVEGIYRDLIIPLTKEIEVEYLFKRCGKDAPVRTSQIWNLR